MTKAPVAPARAPVSLIEKIGYGFGDLASNLVFQTIVNFAAFYYTDVVGIGPGVVGTMFLVVRVFDAVLDPAMGAVADRTRTRWGQFRPWLLWMSVPFGLSAVLAFSVPAAAPGTMIAFSFATYALLMICYTGVNIPYGAMATALTADPQERTSIQSWRFALAMIGNMIVSGLTLPLIAHFGAGDRRLGYSYTMAVFATLGVALLFACFLSTRERVETAPAAEPGKLRRDLKALWQNDQWRLLAFVNFVLLTGLVMRGTATLYFVNYVLKRPDAATAYLTIGTIGGILGSLLAGRFAGGVKARDLGFMIGAMALFLAALAPFGLLDLPRTIAVIAAVLFSIAVGHVAGRRLDRTRVFGIAYATQALVHVLLFFSQPLGFAVSIAAFVTVMMLNQLGVTILWAMMSDSVDYGQWKTGVRLTGLNFSAQLFALKLGVAVGGALAAWLLGLFGYVANGIQSAHALLGITLTFSLLPGLFSVALALLSLRLKLSLPEVAKYQAEIGLAQKA